MQYRWMRGPKGGAHHKCMIPKGDGRKTGLAKRKRKVDKRERKRIFAT